MTQRGQQILQKTADLLSASPFLSLSLELFNCLKQRKQRIFEEKRKMGASRLKKAAKKMVVAACGSFSRRNSPSPVVSFPSFSLHPNRFVFFFWVLSVEVWFFWLYLCL